MKGFSVLWALGVFLLTQDASATTIRRLDWVALNHYAMQNWCTGACLDNLASELGIDVSDPNNIELSGFIETRGQYVRWRVDDRTGSVGGFGYQVWVNDGTEHTPLCEGVSGPFSDIMEASFSFGDKDGSIASGTGLLCGDAADAPNGFASAEGEFGYWREELAGNGWFLMGRVDSISERVPEPGTLALLGFSLLGLGVSRRKA